MQICQCWVRLVRLESIFLHSVKAQTGEIMKKLRFRAISCCSLSQWSISGLLNCCKVTSWKIAHNLMMDVLCKSHHWKQLKGLVWNSSCLIFNIITVEQRPCQPFFLPSWFCSVTWTRLGIKHHACGFHTLGVIYTTPEATLPLHHHLSITPQP